MQIVRDRKNRLIHINQSAYITKLLSELGMENYKSVSTPIEQGSYLHQVDDGYVADPND